MRTRVRRSAVLAAAAGLLALLPVGSASATPAPPDLPVGTLYQAVKDMPASVQRGRTITLVVWYMQRSKDVLAPQQYAVSTWNPTGVDARGSSAPGVTVTWLDPATNRWQPSNWEYDHGAYQSLMLPESPHLTYGSGYWAHIDVRITFSSTVALGTWHIQPIVPEGYSLLTHQGHYASGFLTTSKQPTDFAVSVHR